MSEWNDERLVRAALSQVCGPGTPRLARMVAEHGVEEVWCRVRAGEGEPGWSLRAAMCEPERIAAQAEQHGIRFVIPGDAEWPSELGVLETSQATVAGMGGLPVGLWALGPASLADVGRRGVAIVGARAATRYGELVAQELAAELHGFTVVSGGAYGIDAAAHRGAMEVGGATLGVYAQGLDLVYPQGNWRMYQRLCAEHVVVSEAPPGVPPTKHAFLARNRLIAALARGSIVVEAAIRSGARNTANWAGLMGRVVMAVPGPVTSAASVTPNRLIRDGEAALVSSAEDVLALLADLGTVGETPSCAAPQPFDLLTPEQQAVHEALPVRGGRTVAELAPLSGLSMPKLHSALVALELLGLAQQVADGWRLVRQVAAPGKGR